MRLARDVGLGLLNSFGGMLVSFLAVPFYIRLIGVEAYGLVGFFATLSGVLSLLDLGIGASISREIAHRFATDKAESARQLTRTLALLYLLVGTFGGALLIGAAPYIARWWLISETLSESTLIDAVRLMGLIFALRWPTALYGGALIGAGRVAQTSVISLATVILGAASALAVLMLVSPTVEAFFLTQAVVAAIQVAAMAAATGAAGLGGIAARIDPAVLRPIWRFSLGLAGVSVTALLFTQVDKIVLSKLVSLREFGYYALATTVVSSLYRVIQPVFNVMYPRLTSVAASNDNHELEREYRFFTANALSLFFPIVMLLAVCGEPLVLLWTGDPVVARRTGVLVTILAVGSAIHTPMYFPYTLQLAYGDSAMPLKINMLLLVVLIPLTIILTLWLGAVGGALSWVVLHCLYFPLGTWITHRRYLPDVRWRWTFRDVGAPALVTTGAGALLLSLRLWAGLDAAPLVVAGAALAALAGALSLALSAYPLAITKRALSR